MPCIDEIHVFEQRVQQVERKLFLSALTVLKNQEDAQDALQEAVFRAYLHRSKLRDDKAFEAWITKILLNEAYRLYKKRKKYSHTVALEDCIPFFSENIPSDDIEFFSYISMLSKPEQEVVILRFYHAYSLQEISSILHLPLSTVKSRLYRTLKKLKNQQEEKHESFTPAGKMDADRKTT